MRRVRGRHSAVYSPAAPPPTIRTSKAAGKVDWGTGGEGVKVIENTIPKKKAEFDDSALGL
jgi:hypothetical protein